MRSAILAWGTTRVTDKVESGGWGVSRGGVSAGRGASTPQPKRRRGRKKARNRTGGLMARRFISVQSRKASADPGRVEEIYQMPLAIVGCGAEFVRRQIIRGAGPPKHDEGAWRSAIQAITKDDGFVRGIYGLLPPVGSEKLA